MVDVVYEDNHVIVCIKPQNIPSQLDESGDLDMLTMVKNYIKQKYNKPGNVYVGLVHRLDRPTGGVMVFAKTSKAAQRLSSQIANKDFTKQYLCVCNGTTQKSKNKLLNYLKKDEKLNKVKVVESYISGAKKAELEYNLIATNTSNLSLFSVNLFTGRSHQIRVQMSNIGTPVYGDMRYGGENAQKGKLALWATSLSFTHPVSKERLCFKVEPPKDLLPWKYFDTSKAVDIYN